MRDPAGQVSILIPCYNSAAFIDRTLNFARGQTCSEVTIRVSIDAGSDDTARIARFHAGRDARILVHEQTDRLGWVGNVNLLLGKVDTPFFFIYFHDDVLLPQYTARMREHLLAHPQAVGAYCDMGHFGGTDFVSTGPAYLGTTVERLLTLMLAPQRGSPLRAMLRTDRAAHLRLPQTDANGFWANEPFLMEMLLAGTLEQVPEVLYLRWSNRPGGLTDGWKQLPPQDIVSGWQANIATGLNTLARATTDRAEHAALVFALYLRTYSVLCELRDDHGNLLFPSAASLHPLFAAPGTPELLAAYGVTIEDWARQRFEQCQARDRHA